ncbi:MAG: hypothetical protein AAGI27_07715 [Pseudomonadota bacterium]
MARPPAQEDQHEPGSYTLRRALKWVVYPLLALNLVFYISEDVYRAAQVFVGGHGLFEWIIEMASSIDTLASVIIIVTLELETHVIPDENWKGWIAHVVSKTRYACFALIGLAAVGYFTSVVHKHRDLGEVGVESLCDLVGRDISFVYKLHYTLLGEANCDGLSQETRFYYLGEESIVTTASGVTLERLLSWIDAVDALTWILILISIELVIRLQEKRSIGGGRFRSIYKAKIALYTVLLLNAAIWAYLSLWFYVWDALVWIGAFLVIEMNINQWRDEIRDELDAG